MPQDRIRKLEEIGFVWKLARGVSQESLFFELLQIMVLIITQIFTSDRSGKARKNEYNQKWNDMFEQLKVFRVEVSQTFTEIFLFK